MSKKILSAVLAIAMVVSLCASLFTVGASAATNYEADRAALKEAIQELFIKGPSVSEETIDFLTDAGVLTAYHNTTLEEIARNKVFKVNDPGTCGCGCNTDYINNDGKYDAEDDYFVKADSELSTEIDALLQEAATAYYFGQNADELIVDASFNEGRNEIVKEQLKAIEAYMEDLVDEIGAKTDKPADYAALYTEWVSKYHKDGGQYNPNFGINPYGNLEYDEVDWFKILQGYAGNTLGWVSFDTIRADAAKANLLNVFERLYRAAQTTTLEGVLFYDFVTGKKAELENAWNALINSLKTQIKWDLPAVGSVAEDIKAFNTMKKVIEFFDAYIVDAYLNIYTSTDAALLSNITMAKSVYEFVKGQDDAKEAMFISAIGGAAYFNKITNDLISGIAALNPAASNLALTNADIANGVKLVNDAQQLVNAYANVEAFATNGKAYNAQFVALKNAIAAFKVLLPYDAESYASYVVSGDVSVGVKDINGTEIKATNSTSIAFVPNYFAYTRYMIALNEALENYVAAIEAYNGALASLGKVELNATNVDKANLSNALVAYDFLVGELVTVADGVAKSDADFAAIASGITKEFVAKIVLIDRETANGVIDDKAVAQYNAFKAMYGDAFEKHNDSNFKNEPAYDWKTESVNYSATGSYTKIAEELIAMLPYLTADLEELINIYSYEANVLANYFGIPAVVLGGDLADYQNPANYIGFAEKTFDTLAYEKATVADVLAYLADLLGADVEVYLEGYDTIDNETVKEILAEINGVIAWYNENLAGTYELPEIVITTHDIEDMIDYYIENEAAVKAEIDAAIAEVEAQIDAIMAELESKPAYAVGAASIAYGLINLYNAVYGDGSVVEEEVIINSILEAEAQIEAIFADLEAKLSSDLTAEELVALLKLVNDILDWYNANIAGVYELPEIEELNEDVYAISGYFAAEDIWAAIAEKAGADTETDFFLKVEGDYTVVTSGVYYDMMQNYFKLVALCAQNVNVEGYKPSYETKATAASLNAARKAFIDSVKVLLTDDRGDELVDEFISDVISWVNTKYTGSDATNNSWELVEKLEKIFGEADDCKALTLPTDAAEPYLYFNFTLAHVVSHDYAANKYNKANGGFEDRILEPLKDKSKASEDYNVSGYDTEWVANFKTIREKAGYVLDLIDGDEIKSDIPLYYVLGVLEQLDAILDTADEHTVDVLAAYKAAVLDPAIAAAQGKNMYDYTIDTDAGAKVWANYEAAYAAAVAAKYNTRMPKSEIDTIVETLNKALESLVLVKKPDSAATIADLEAKIVAGEALLAKADDLDTANKVARVNDLKAAIAAAKQAIVDLKYVTNYNKYDIQANINAIQTAMDNVVASQTFADDLNSYLTFILNAVQLYYAEYTEESFNALVAVWQEAQKLATDDSLNASAYVAAKAKVAAAYQALEYKPAPEAPAMTKTFEAAVAKLAELKAVATTGYTAESVAAFNAAVAALEAGIEEVAADDALLELITNAYLAKAGLAAVVTNPTTCD
ncbi:MAG: hypothetical protein E7481_03555 [Ruminococcaceae bacterium]|nr:hypothetical protein [Oscillospiraceae bacterium]